jgi:hypothetical protein
MEIHTLLVRRGISVDGPYIDKSSIPKMIEFKNILVINQHWFVKEWRETGARVVTCGHTENFDICFNHNYISSQEILNALPQNFEPDLCIVHDNGAPLSLRKVSHFPFPTCFYSVDTHHMAFLHRNLCHLFDHVFVAQKDYLASFLENNCTWLPLWASEVLTEVAPSDRTHPAIFVGTLDKNLNPSRVAFLDSVKKQTTLEVLQGHFLPLFAKAQIVLNQTVKGDLNFRVFEAMGAGALLVSEHSGNGLLELFQPSKHLVTYPAHDHGKAAELINYYIKHTAEAEQIARAGQHVIFENHLASHRAFSILETMKEVAARKRLEGSVRHNNAKAKLSELEQLTVCVLTFDCLDRPAAIEGFSYVFEAFYQLIDQNIPLPSQLQHIITTATHSFDFRVAGNIGARVREKLHENNSASNEELTIPPLPQDPSEWRELVGQEITELQKKSF